MRIGILVFNQPDLTPQHFISKDLASKFLAYRSNGKRAVECVTSGLLRIVIDVTFAKLKALLKGRFKDSPPKYNQGKPFIPENLPASLDGMLGLIVQAPVLPNQIRFRHI